MPNLVPSAQKVVETTDKLSRTAEKIAIDADDEVLEEGIKPGIEHLSQASRGMLKASQTLRMNTLDRTARATLVESARGVLEGTLKILLEIDGAEVRKIVKTAQLVMDRCTFVEGVKSMQGLVVCFKNFSDCVVELAHLANNRQQQLVNPRLRERIVTAITNLKKFVPMLSDSMQRFVKFPTNPQAKASRDYVISQIMLAVTEIIRAVESTGFRDDLEPGYIATSMDTLQMRLGPGSRHAVNSELDQYMEAIIRNSMAVAHVCNEAKKQEIIQSCHEVTKLQQELAGCLREVQANPDSQRARDKFDSVAEQLCEEFRLLDHLVNSAVVQQVANVFVETATPMNQLVGAATLPTQKRVVDARKELAKYIEAFKSHAARLSQVSSSAAASSQDARRVQVIRVTASELDRLTPQIVSAAIAVRQNAEDSAARAHLEMLRKEWASKVQLLTTTIDEITDKGDFMAAAEASIREDVANCRDAISEGDLKKLEMAALSATARSRRVAEVAHLEIHNSDDPHFCRKLESATARLEAAIPVVATCLTKVINKVNDVHTQRQFAESTRELLESVRDIKNSMPGRHLETVHGRDISTLQTPFVIAQGSHVRTAERVVNTPHAGSVAYQDVVSKQRLGGRSTSAEVVSMGSHRMTGKDEASIQEKKMLLIGPKHSPATAALEKLERSTLERSTAERTRSDHTGYDRTGYDHAGFEHSGFERKRRPRSAEVGSQTDLTLIPDAGTGVLSQAALERLITAARSGLPAEVDAESVAIRKRGDVLINLANAAVNSSSDRDKTRIVHVIASDIEKLIPQLLDSAHFVNQDPSSSAAVEKLRVIGQTWAEKVNILTTTVDHMVAPWSSVPILLAKAVFAGDVAGLTEHTEALKTFTERIKALAASAIEAADAEDTVDSAAERDPAAVKRIEVLQTLSNEIEKMTTQLIGAARTAALNTGNQPAIEHFEILRRDWAGKVKALTVAVDDITVGTSSLAEALALSAERSERPIVKDNSDALRKYVAVLKEISEDATAGCGDHEKVELALTTAADVETLTNNLIAAAADVIESVVLDDSSIHVAAIEKVELLRREWATRVHLLTAVVDDLTSEVSSPVDRLAGAALAVSRSSEQQREKLMGVFREQASALRDRVARVEERASAAVRDSVERKKVGQVHACTEQIVKLTPQVVTSARGLVENPDQATVEHFQLLRRQWASKAQLLVTTLDEIPDCDMSAASVAMQELLSPPGGGDMPGYMSGPFSIDYNRVPVSQKPSQPSPPVLQAKPHPEEQTSSTGPSPHPKRASTGGMSDVATSTPRSSYFSGPPHSTPTHAKARPISAIATPTSWKDMSASDEDLAANMSSRSIKEAARVLQDQVDQFELGGNDFIILANRMAGQMFQMAEYSKGRGQLQSKPEMINTAKAIAANGNVIVQFAHLIAERCMDKRMRDDLQYYAEMIPTLTQQLRIISSVKAATPKDPSTDVMLMKNAQNLMHAVKKTMQAAEAACMKGLRDLEEGDAAEELAFEWKRKVYKERTLEQYQAPVGATGLRKLRRNTSAPTLAHAQFVS
jgi:hypothetical protein